MKRTLLASSIHQLQLCLRPHIELTLLVVQLEYFVLLWYLTLDRDVDPLLIQQIRLTLRSCDSSKVKIDLELGYLDILIV